MSNQIRKEDVLDVDFVDAYELRSDGYGLNSIYLSGVSVISTTSGTQTVLINLASDGEGILYSRDHPVEANDIVWLSGTSGGLADGYYTVNSIVDDTSFIVNESLATSTGGLVQFRYPAGALRIGFNPTGTSFITHNDVQHAIEDLDFAISSGGGGLTPTEHEKLRQLIHLADGIGGPFEGFTTNAYRETTPLSNPFPTSIIWWTNSLKTSKYVEKSISYNGNKTPSVLVWKVYDTDGSTVLATVTDTIVYSGVFELHRTRGIVSSTPTPTALTTETHKYVRQLIHLADGIGGPFEGFSTNAYREITPSSNPFPTSIIWYEDATKVKKIVAKSIIYNINKTVSSVSWQVYDTDGSTVLATVTDVPIYSGIFENNRTRSIS